MSEEGKIAPLPPFPSEYRASGILLHMTSLPSRYGIGDFGPTAMAWVDRLHAAGQHWWQVLPLSPIGEGYSPYQCLSSFARNELLVSPDWLVEDGLLQASDCDCAFPAETVEYETVALFKRRLLDRVWRTFRAKVFPGMRRDFETFAHDQAAWLDNYALFMALKGRFDGRHLLEWPSALLRREPAAMAEARRDLAEPIGQARFVQFLLFRQAARLRRYAHEKGIAVIGDLPFFVSLDSCDVWANPELFLLDRDRRPRAVAGVPPDYFSEDGQLWGNPLYDWDAVRRSGYRWWIQRLRALLNDVDLIRLDHFRAFTAAWHVPAESRTARVGEWVPGPGAEFFEIMQRELEGLPFIAEDLGLITPDVYALRDRFQVPGMRVLQFAFDGKADNPYLPHMYVTNTVVYTGTHDNPTTRGWFEALSDEERGRLYSHLGRAGGTSEEPAPELLRLAWSSRAALAMAPLQDVLNLGNDARMNTPGRPEGNWRWRFTEDMLPVSALDWLRDLTIASKRTMDQATVR